MAGLARAIHDPRHKLCRFLWMPGPRPRRFGSKLAATLARLLPMLTPSEASLPGLVPGIHASETGMAEPKEDADGRAKPGHGDHRLFQELCRQPASLNWTAVAPRQGMGSAVRLHRPNASEPQAMAGLVTTLRLLGDRLQVGASVRNVFGDPITAGARTVLPLARLRYGFGAGGGVGGSEQGEPERGGSGGGAGISARPVGVLEIAEGGTRFIPFVDPVRLATALMVGLLIGFIVGRGGPRGR
jgi:uncharacterized spore protein YtfJ